jgi:iron complex outermembrane receptor protein
LGVGDYKADGKSLMLSFDLSTQNATTVRDGSFDIRASEYAAMNNRLNPYYSYVTNQPFFFKERALNSKIPKFRVRKIRARFRKSLHNYKGT